MRGGTVEDNERRDEILGGCFNDLDNELDKISQVYVHCRCWPAFLDSEDDTKLANRPFTTMLGGQIVALSGGRFPFALRPVSDSQREFVGPAFVWGPASPTDDYVFLVDENGATDGINWDSQLLQNFIII